MLIVVYCSLFAIRSYRLYFVVCRGFFVMHYLCMVRCSLFVVVCYVSLMCGACCSLFVI